METYKIINTTDGKHIGKKFTINTESRSVNIEGYRILKFKDISYKNDNVKIINVNYTIIGQKI